MGLFGWDLPPGCSMNDIERAFGDQPNIEDSFGANGKLTKEEKIAWDNEDSNVMSLVTKALEWAYECGYQACKGEVEEAKFYKELIDKEVPNE